MYHAVYRSDSELSEIAPVDRPYAITLREFTAHLDLIQRQGLPVFGSATEVSPGTSRAVQLTFDDGHEGWFTHVLPLLRERAMGAVFFVTSDLIGKPGYCNRDQVKALSEAGMEVGGHGKTHRFLSDIDDQSCLLELQESKRAIEEIISGPVRSMSFPGGRFSDTTLELGKSVGYSEFYTSVPGVNALPSADQAPLMRFDIKPAISPGEFERIIKQDSRLIRKVRLIAGAKKRVKWLLGSNNYKKLYDRVYAGKQQ
jgi:peptidoglycan/xylan/chitin deacetylase (PgdA/CDA1 family)